MVGASKVYSRTLVPPTISHDAATDLWTVTINTNSKVVKILSVGMAVGDLLGRSDDYANSHVNNNNSTKNTAFFMKKRHAPWHTQFHHQ
jgi:hypothetical protein